MRPLRLHISGNITSIEGIHDQLLFIFYHKNIKTLDYSDNITLYIPCYFVEIEAKITFLSILKTFRLSKKLFGNGKL